MQVVCDCDRVSCSVWLCEGMWDCDHVLRSVWMCGCVYLCVYACRGCVSVIASRVSCRCVHSCGMSVCVPACVYACRGCVIVTSFHVLYGCVCPCVCYVGMCPCMCLCVQGMCDWDRSWRLPSWLLLGAFHAFTACTRACYCLHCLSARVSIRILSSPLTFSLLRVCSPYSSSCSIPVLGMHYRRSWCVCM